jgi:mannose-6-phosphate isomerase
MKDILFLSGLLKERIWGGHYFKDVLHKTQEDKLYGELWSASAYKEGESFILNGDFKGKKLSEIYKEHPEIFNFPKNKEFPILVKLIATSQDLSVQVHPDDEYAQKNENQLGKTEGWLILDCQEKSKIVFGHNAHNKEEFLHYFNNQNFEKLLNWKKVKAGEFYAIYAGTLHAIGANIVLLEIQQSSDVTYRLYDYNRLDQNGKMRELHVSKALDVITYNNAMEVQDVFTNDEMKVLWDNSFFKVELVTVKENYTFNSFQYYGIVSVIQGCFEIAGQMVGLGDSFIITKLASLLNIKGNGRIVITTPKE